MPDYLTVACRLPASAEERLAQAMESWPVLGCQVEDAGSEVDVTVFLDEKRGVDVPLVCEGLRALGASEIDTGHFADKDWLSGYRQATKPRALGTRFWIDPHPKHPTPAPDGRIHLLVEPRQAFGSGSHESTQLVLLLLEEIDLAGRRVLDVGTGSGILALAARSLGASWAVGLDIDAEAVFVARQTVAEHPGALGVALLAGPSSALGAGAVFDVILANMLPAQVEPLLAELRAMLAPAGVLVVSGLMVDQRAAVEAELAESGLAVAAAKELGEWAGLVCRRSGHRASGAGHRRTLTNARLQ